MNTFCVNHQKKNCPENSLIYLLENNNINFIIDVGERRTRKTTTALNVCLALLKKYNNFKVLFNMQSLRAILNANEYILNSDKSTNILSHTKTIYTFKNNSLLKFSAGIDSLKEHMLGSIPNLIIIDDTDLYNERYEDIIKELIIKSNVFGTKILVLSHSKFSDKSLTNKLINL